MAVNLPRRTALNEPLHTVATERTSIQTLPDIISTGLAIVFCGINPGMSSATSGHHFAAGSNRFWRVLHLAGFTPEQISPQQDHTLLAYGYGLTTAVERPTARADELSKDEFLVGRDKLTKKIESYAPRCIAFLGKAAFSSLSGQRKVLWGPQPGTFGGARVWVLPNPSGLNRAFSLDDLVRAYRKARLEFPWFGVGHPRA